MINNHKLKNSIILLLLIFSAIVSLSTVSADTTYHSQQLVTIDNGTVSGGLYSDSFFGYDEQNVNINYSNTIKTRDNSQTDNNGYSTDTSNPSAGNLNTQGSSVSQGSSESTSESVSGSPMADSSNNEEIEDRVDFSDVNVDFNDRNVTYIFKPVSDNVKVRSAHLITSVYMANMYMDYPVPIELSFNGKTLLNETLSATYTNDGPVILNDNITRVTSDYVIHYDVTDLISLDANYIRVDLTKSQTARVKMSNLIIAYDDDDYDSYYYTINLGHDVANIDDYVGSTKFHGVYSGSDVYEAKLTSYYLASTNALYRFNGEILESFSPQGGYDGVCSWNVTGKYNIGLDNTLEFQRVGAYFKIVASTMLVRYYNQNMLPDLTVKNVILNPNSEEYRNMFCLDETNQVGVSLENIGSRDAKQFDVTLKLNNQSYTKSVSNLNSFERKIILFDVDYNYDVENVKISVIIDMEDIVSEVTHENNIYSSTYDAIYTKFSDLDVSDVIFEDDITINKMTTLQINITNVGLRKSSDATVNVYVDDDISRNLIKTMVINPLDIGQSTIINVNWTPRDYGYSTINVIVNQSQDVEEINYDNNNKNFSVIVYNPNKISIFIISDNSGTNSYNQASKSVLTQYAGLVDIQIRTDNQALTMSDQELKAYLESSDIFIADWLSSGIYEKLNKILANNPDINKNKMNKIFLILEPPVSTTVSSVDFMKNSTFIIKGTDKISQINNVAIDVLYDYYFNTSRGLLYSEIYEYIKNTEGIPDLYNRATLYKDIGSVDGHRNMLLWLLNSINPTKYTLSYNLPPESLNTPVYGIYREKWYSYIDDEGNWQTGFEEYKNDYINSSRPTIGLIESKLYVDSQQLQPYYAMIDKFESLGLNVIPIVAYGGTNEQLEVMYRIFTNCSSLSEFMDNTTESEVRIDALINMVAYGLGGTDFNKVTPFFTRMNVPILKAVHSDYVSNAEYDLGTTGLGTLSGDKWWHITISEAQGAVTPTFVGGYDSYIDDDTGASISGYVPHEGNIEVLGNSVYNWVLLKYLENSQKKIALIYYNYPPGKQNIAASYLDPVESVLNLLNILKDNGYDVKNIPSNSTILLAQMLSQGTNVANWANGLVEVMADFNNSSYDEIYGYQYNNTYQIDLENMTEDEINSLKDTPGVLLYPVSKFKQWYDKLDDINKVCISEGPIAYIGECAKKAVDLNYTNYTDNLDQWYNGVIELVPGSLSGKVIPLIKNITETLKSYVLSSNESYYDEYLLLKEEFLSYEIQGLSGWGEFPGNIMIVEREGTQYFVLPGIQYGNVFIAPEPQRGWEGNAEQLYHNSIVPPHYQYLAFYSYLQDEEYNAMVFIGRHATHEWLSGKEVLCSDSDFTTVVTGSIPQVYFYITDGISEGLTAKRRASAVIIDHLTPPMTLTTLYGNLSYLHSLTEEYEVADNDMRVELANSMREVILAEEYNQDMNINLSDLDDDELVSKINDYINSLTSTLYPYGVHVIGQNWSDDEIALLVSSMLSTEYEYNEAGDTTSLIDEISYLYENKRYSDISASKRSDIQDKCVNIVKELITTDKDVLLNRLTDNPTEALNKSFDLALSYIKTLKQSTANEVNSFINALSAGYVEPGSGGDPINNPGAIDTGKNFYQDQSSEIPTKIAYDKSKELLDVMLNHTDKNTTKVVLGIWDTETARDDGQLVSLVLRLLGMKPTWSSSPSAGADGKKLKETPEYEELEDMYRPDGWNKTRIDVVVVLDGNFRDLYSRQVGLMDKAFRIALARSYYTIINNQTLTDRYGDDLINGINAVMDTIGYYGISDESLEDNAVANNWIDDFGYYMSIDMTAEQAAESAISRIFAPPESDYGALISQAVRQSWTFNDTEELALKYINRMGYIYSSTNWGSYNSQVLERLLNGTTSLFTSRNTNLYGVIDNDDYFDYWGGLYNAMYYINNADISFDVIKYGENLNASIIEIDQYLKREMNTRYYNPEWIKAMMEEDYSGAGYMSRFASNLYGWATVTDKVTDKDWDNMVSVYIDDKYNLGVDKFLTTGYNSYSMISITGTLLTAAYDGKWHADDETLRKVANIWAQSVIDNGVACCDCSCGNIFMIDWSLKYINPDILSQFKAKMFQATQNKLFYEDGYSQDPNANGTTNGTGDAGDGNNTGVVTNSSGSVTNNTGNSTDTSTNSSSVDGSGTGNQTADTNQTSNSTINNNSTSNSTAQSNTTTNSTTENNTTNANSTTPTNQNSTDTNSTNQTDNNTNPSNTTDNNDTQNNTNIPDNPTDTTHNNSSNSTNTTPANQNTTDNPITNTTNQTDPINNQTQKTNQTTDNTNQTQNDTNNTSNMTENTTDNTNGTTPIKETNTTIPENTTTPIEENNNTKQNDTTEENNNQTIPTDNQTQNDTKAMQNDTNQTQHDISNVTTNDTQSIDDDTNQTSDYNQTQPIVNPVVENTTTDNVDINNTQQDTLNNTDVEQNVGNDDDNEDIEEDNPTQEENKPTPNVDNNQENEQEDNNEENIVNNQESEAMKDSPKTTKVTELLVKSQENSQSGNVADSAANSATVNKAYELTKSKKGSAIIDSAMSALAILFVLSLLGSIAYGYYRKRA